MTETSIDRDRRRRAEYRDAMAARLNKRIAVCATCATAVYDVNGYSDLRIILNTAPKQRSAGYITAITNGKFHVRYVIKTATEPDLPRYLPHTCITTEQ